MIIKQRTQGTLAIYSVNNAVIAYANAPQFKQALELADKGLPEQERDKAVDVVIYSPESYADMKAEEVLIPEQLATTTREDVNDAPIAVLITDDDDVICGTHYQFLYAKDYVEILTDNGQLLAVANGQLPQ